MKLFEIPTVVTALVGLCFLAGLDMPAAQADFTFGEPVNLRSTIPVIGPAHESIDCISSDGLEIYIVSDRPGGSGVNDIWVIKRATVDSEWSAPENLGPTINSASQDNGAWISGDGLTLHFASNRPGGYGNFDMYRTTRTTAADPWGPAVNLGPAINSPTIDRDACISPDGLEFYVSSRRSGGYGSGDIYVAKRATRADPWGELVNLGPTINSAYDETALCLSPDGLLLLYSDNFGGGTAPRPGGHGGSDMWMARRAAISSPWQTSVNLGSPVNSSKNEIMPHISRDGSTLYFVTNAGGIWDNWQAPILPIVDFNGDGKVDAKDMDLLMTDWGKTNSVYDIGPFAWGDGLVDEKDLGVLMKSLVTPGPGATDVSCDTVLSWTLTSSTPACDVYLGTSEEAVNTASRANPQGVLVSQAQTAASYDPPGLLELSQTYYWRVDFVIAGPTPTIIRGPVLKLTTAALRYPIKNVTAKASSAQAGSGWERTVDGSGLDKNDGHSTDQKDMWWSQGAAPHWIQYEFEKVYTLHEMWVWNFNMMIEPFMGFGAKTVKIEYSTDGTAWTALANVPEFAKATGKAGYTANTIVSFAGVPAKFVKLTIEKNWSSSAPQTGLSEVRFFCIQSAAVPKP